MSPPTILLSLAIFLCVKYRPGAQWKMTTSYLGGTDLSSVVLSITPSSSRTPSNSPILANVSTATTCQTVSASSTLLIQEPSFATFSNWVKRSQKFYSRRRRKKFRRNSVFCWWGLQQPVCQWRCSCCSYPVDL